MAQERMSVHDVCAALRANGVSFSEDVMKSLILENKMPFAVGTKTEKGQTVTLIFRGAFYRWLDDMLGRRAVRAYE